MRYSVLQRVTCRLCGGVRFETVLEISAIPLSDGFLEKEKIDNEFLYPLKIEICLECGLLQTLYDIDFGDYYRSYKYSVGHSEKVLGFFRGLVDNLWIKFGLKVGDIVIDVGCGDGALLSCFLDKGANVIGVEPSDSLSEIANKKGIKRILKKFDKEAIAELEGSPIMLIVSLFTFDHMPDPLGFLLGARQVLSNSGGLLVLEVHDLDKIVERGEFCLFAHEHSIYCSKRTLERFLWKANFEPITFDLIDDTQRRANSLLVVARPKTSEEEVMFEGVERDVDLARLIRKQAKQSMEGISRWFLQRVGRKIAGFGAGGRGVMSLAVFDENPGLAYICDSNKSLHGLLTPKTHVEISPPQRLRIDPVDDIIVFSYGYMDEIEKMVRDIGSEANIYSLLDVYGS